MVFFALLALVAGGTLALMLGLMGLAEAPWPVLVGILVLTLVGLQRVTGNRAISTPVSPPLSSPLRGTVPAWNTPNTPPSPGSTALTPVAPPNLVYRGVPYAPKTSLQPQAPQTITLEGTYRGRHWQKSVPAWPTPTLGTENSPSPSPGGTISS